MQKIKISVIVPVYNVEEYIEECIESIVNQTLKEIEIIIVNDGTKDNSIKKIEKYFSDPRIILINKENGGISSARNAGLKIARGEYISFIDSDDFIEPTMLEDLYNNSEKAEIVFSNIISYDNKTGNKSYSESRIEFGILNKGSYLFNTLNLPFATLNKIYKKDYLERINLTFIKGIIYEDSIFSIKALFLANKVKYIDKNHYNYRVNRNGSTMTITHSDRKKEKFNSFNLLAVNSLKIIVEEIENFEKKYGKNWSIFEKINLKILELKFKILLLKEKNEKYLEKKEFESFEVLLKKEWNLLSKLEKKVLKKEIDGVLKSKVIVDINIFDPFWWKNRFFTKKSLRRIVEAKIKNILKGES